MTKGMGTKVIGIGKPKSFCSGLEILWNSIFSKPFLGGVLHILQSFIHEFKLLLLQCWLAEHPILLRMHLLQITKEALADLGANWGTQILSSVIHNGIVDRQLARLGLHPLNRKKLFAFVKTPFRKPPPIIENK